MSLRYAITLSMVTPMYAASQSAKPIEFHSFSFAASSGALTEADSGTLLVPKNRQSKAGGSVHIPVVRFASRAPTNSVPVIYISGGTGSGIAAARGSRFDMFMSMRSIGDVYTMDLRGAGRSTPPVDCGPARLPVADPLSYEAVVAHVSAEARKCADSLRKTGVDLSGHNVREVVDDINALRRAIGAKRVNLVGISTGSQIVLEYARRYPANVNRIIAAGVQAPDQNLHMPAEMDRVIRTLAESLPAGGPDLVAGLRAVLDSLGRAPRSVAVRSGSQSMTVSVGKLDMQLVVAGMLGDRRQMAFLPRMLAAARRGDYTMLAGAKLAGARAGITSSYEASMDCQTGATPERMREVAAQAKTALLGLGTLDFPGHCAAWGVRRLDDSYRAPVKSSAPILLISGTLDGRTPVRNAREALRYLPSGSHLIISGASHGDDLFLSSPGIVPTMLRFLASAPAFPRHLYLTAQ